LHFVQQGEGPNIVFAHGFVMDHTMFAAQFEELPKTHRCVAYDMRGHGHSDCPDGPWTMQDLVDDLIEFGEGEAPHAHLVGMSIGGMTAVRAALQRPDLFRSLTLIDADAGPCDPNWVGPYKEFQATIERDGITDELVRSTVPLFYGQAFIDAEPDAIVFHVERVKEMPRVALVEGLRVLIERESVTDKLPGLTLPTLVIHGELDLSIPPGVGEETAKAIPGAEFVLIPGAGHTTPMEAPDAVNDALAAFYRRVD
jgi:pimeloyl-ACP methyl ester carboxylesterase